MEEIRRRLGHSSSSIDLLKFDIEGYEWDFIEDVLLRPLRPERRQPNHADQDDVNIQNVQQLQQQDENHDHDFLPFQIAFELHTRGANRRFVPESISRNKGRKEVNQLFWDLYHLGGYRVVDKALNFGDKSCAEFVLIRI